MFFRIVYKSRLIFLPFCHNTRVWQTDGQTDRILITIPRLHYMQRGKNVANWNNDACTLYFNQKLLSIECIRENEKRCHRQSNSMIGGIEI